jgi:hypothetical protein
MPRPTTAEKRLGEAIKQTQEFNRKRAAGELRGLLDIGKLPNESKTVERQAAEHQVWQEEENRKLDELLERGFRFESALTELTHDQHHATVQRAFQEFGYDSRNALHWLWLLRAFSDAHFAPPRKAGRRGDWTHERYLRFLCDYAHKKALGNTRPDSEIFRAMRKLPQYKRLSEAGVKRAWQRARDPNHNLYFFKAIEVMEVKNPGFIERWARHKNIEMADARQDIAIKMAEGMIEDWMGEFLANHIM